LIVEKAVKELAGKRKVWKRKHRDGCVWTVGLTKNGGRKTVDFQVELFLIVDTPVLVARVFGIKGKREEVINTLNQEVSFEKYRLTSLSLNRAVEIKEKVYEFEIYVWTLNESSIPIGPMLDLEFKRLSQLTSVRDFFNNI
jgi:hypothetical protein